MSTACQRRRLWTKAAEIYTFFLLLSPFPSALLFCLTTAGNNCPPPNRLCFPLYFSGLGRRWQELVFHKLISAFHIRPDLWQNLQKIGSVLKKIQPLPSPPARIFVLSAVIFAKYIDCLKCQNTGEAENSHRNVSAPTAASSNLSFSTPLLKKKKKASNRIVFKAGASEFLAAFLLFLFEFWLERLIAGSSCPKQTLRSDR